jgi:hypothetical protein
MALAAPLRAAGSIVQERLKGSPRGQPTGKSSTAPIGASIVAQAPAPADNTENPLDVQDTSDWRRARRHMTATTGQASGGDTPFAQP